MKIGHTHAHKAVFTNSKKKNVQISAPFFPTFLPAGGGKTRGTYLAYSTKRFLS